MANLKGRILGNRYRVDQFLGRGGMADVYKVWDMQRAVPLALKVLHEKLAADATFKLRFEREARTLQTLQHPNIVRCYGLEESEGLAYILMDYIDGLTLRREILLHHGGMPPERIVEVMQPVCAALYYAHNLGMAHCDIKPANILIQRGGAVYLTDFGIARATESSALAAGGSQNAALGTPAYMAPEQIPVGKGVTGEFGGADAKPDPAVDIYGLGVALFEMLSGGKRPFRGEQSATPAGVVIEDAGERIFWEKRNLTAPSPRLYNPGVSAEFEAIVARCLDRSPERRFGSALELQQALERAAGTQEYPGLAGHGAGDDDEVQTLTDLSAAGSSAPESASGYWPRVPARWKAARWMAESVKHATPRQRMLALTGVLALALMLALASGPVLRAFSANDPSTAATQVSQGSAERGVRGAANGDLNLPANTEQAEISATQPAPTLPEASTTAEPSAAPSSQPTALGGGAAQGGGEPGGAWLAFASDRGDGSVQIWIMDPQSPGNHRQMTDLPGGACQPAWSPDGKRLAFTTPCIGPSIFYIGSTIKMVDVDTRQISDLPLPRNSFDPDWSADGESIYYTALISSKAEVHALDLEDMSIRKVSERGSKSAQPASSPDGSHVVFITSSESNPDMLWLMEGSGSSPELVNDGDFFSDPVFAPDETHVLVTMNRSGMPRLALVELHHPSSPPAALFDLEYPQRYGAFSPDGQWVAFWSELANNDKGEIMLASVDGKQVRQLTQNKAREFHPAWGRTLPAPSD